MKISLAIIEVYFHEVCLSSRRHIGVQDWTQTKAVAAAGKNALPNAGVLKNEAYQFASHPEVQQDLSQFSACSQWLAHW